jgi:hypothetical protein
MSDRGGRGRIDVALMMVLQPVSLVRGVEADVVMVQRKELNEESSILKAQWRESCAVGQGDANEAPLASRWDP